MADSSKSTGLGKPALDKEAKKKRQRGRKFGRAKYSEDSGNKSQESSAGTSHGDELNIKENDGDRKVDVGETSQTITKEEIEEEGSTKHGDEKAPEEIEQVDKNDEQFVNKDGPQDVKLVQECSEEKQVIKSDIANEQDEVGSSKKTKRLSLTFFRGSKRFSKYRLSHGEDKSVEDMKSGDESSQGESKGGAVKDDETSQQQAEMYDEAKSELGAIYVDMKSKDFEESLEGVQERPTNKGNKGKKLKQFASFGRNKKKYIVMKRQEDELPDSETQKSEKEESKKSQNIDASSNEPAAPDNSDSTNKCFDARAEENESKEDGNAKSKGSFLGLKRSKSQSKKKKTSKSEDELNKSEKIPTSKSDDVSAMEGAPLEENTVETEERSELNAAKTADLQMEETPGAAETKDESNQEEMGIPEITADEEATGAVEEMSQASTKKDRKSRILRSFRKLRSTNSKAQQGKKETQENEKIVNKKMEQPDEVEDSEPKQTTEGETSTDGTYEEVSFNAGKRKTSDLRDIGRIRAMKRKKKDYEKCGEDSEDYDEYDEKEDEEEIANDQTVDESTKKKTECADEFDSPANNELSKQKNNKEEETKNKESSVQDEIPREEIARDNTHDEDDTSSAAQEPYRKQMKTVIDELLEVIEKKEERIGKENCVQVEENVESSTADKTGFSERPTIDNDETDDEEKTDDEEGYDSDLTIVSQIIVDTTTYEAAAEHKTELKPQDEEIRQTLEGECSQTAKLQVADTKSEGITEPNTGDEEKRIVHEEKSSETELPRVAETKREDTTEPKAEDEKDQKRETTTEDAKQYSVKSEARDSPVNQDAEESSEAETSRETEPQIECKTEPKAEEVKESSEAAISQIMVSAVEQQNEHPTGDVEEVDQETERKTEDAEAMRVSECEPEDKTEPNTRANEEVSSEKVLSEAANEEPGVKTSLQGQMVEASLTEPENNKKAVGAENAVKPNKRDKKRKSKADRDNSDPFKNNPNAWIMVQHLEMNDEITRQLGNMLMINGFKRTTTCCTIM